MTNSSRRGFFATVAAAFAFVTAWRFKPKPVTVAQDTDADDALDFPQGAYFENCFEVNPMRREVIPGVHKRFVIDSYHGRPGPGHYVAMACARYGRLWPTPIHSGPYQNCSAIPEGPAKPWPPPDVKEYSHA
jgi:hypothetical protein